MSSDRTIHCVVITPDRVVLDERVGMVVVPLYDGEFAIYPGRAPVIAELGYGELRFASGALVKRLYVDGGFLHVKDDEVSVLTTGAAWPEELDEEAIRQRLAEQIRRVPKTAEEEAEREREINRAIGQLLTIRRSRQ